jgi:hypothetical protein
MGPAANAVHGFQNLDFEASGAELFGRRQPGSTCAYHDDIDRHE